MVMLQRLVVMGVLLLMVLMTKVEMWLNGMIWKVKSEPPSEAQGAALGKI